MPGFDRLVLTCEHGGNFVPPRYRALFAGHQPVLQTHRGSDLGAASLTHAIARKLDVTPHIGRATRLLVELNRSPHSRTLYSEFSRGLDDSERQRLFDAWWRPYREAAFDEIKTACAGRSRVLHLSIHSFTPKLHGQIRKTDFGLLYDPALPAHLNAALRWKRTLQSAAPTLRTRRNYPYTGLLDGFIPWIRKRLPTDRYVGVELEVNNKHLTGSTQKEVERAVADAVAALWAELRAELRATR